MKKTFKLEDLDCANCAAKMEAAVAKLPGVTGARVNFMSQRFTLEADDAEFQAVLEQAIKTMRRVEPDCVVVL